MKKNQSCEEIHLVGSPFQSCYVRGLPVPGFKRFTGNCAVGEAMAEFESVELSVDANFGPLILCSGTFESGDVSCQYWQGSGYI